MTKLAFPLVIIGMMALSAVAQPKDWKMLDITGDAAITGYFMYQPDATIKTGHHTFKSWLKYGDINKKIIKEMLFELQCSRRQFRPLTVITSSMKGKLMRRAFSSNSVWLEITPDSVNENFFTRICDQFDQ